MAAIAYWQEKVLQNGNYQCPWCPRDLKAKLSNSAKNPNKLFVSCSQDHGGCGLFCFLDSEPNEQFNPAKKRSFCKRDRDESGVPAPKSGNNIVGPVVNRPDVHETRLAELAAEVAGLRSELRIVVDFVKQATDN